MRYMGIDYGNKRIGIAVSDDSGKFALPFKVLDNTKSLTDDIFGICKEKNIECIILGESKNYRGEDNLIMSKVKKLKMELEEKSNLPVILEPEFMTSAEAEHLQGKNDMLDASAAALILKSYLEKNKQ